MRRLCFVGLTALLWVVPSLGTQGMATTGQHVVHTDSAIFDTVATQRDATRRVLDRSDAATEATLGL